MHLYLLTRGITYEVNKFVDMMQANMLPYPVDDKTIPYSVQLAMRPVQLWECVFPKAALPNVLKAIWYKPETRKDMEKALWAMRKLVQAKKIPDLDLSKTLPVNTNMNNMGVYAIGIKEDKGVWPSGPYKGGEQL